MKLNKTIYITLLISALTLIGCGGSGGDDSPNPPPSGGNDDDPVNTDPSAATLIFPEDDSECTTGVVDPDDASMSTITFQWNASENTDRYTVTINNINTGSATFANSDTNEVSAKIERGQPYEWFVTSRSNSSNAVANSASFRFFNEGPGIENYAPFPAEAVRPERGVNMATTDKVTLEWSASDVDDDISEYEVFFGTDADALTSIGTTTASETSLADVAVTGNTTYYWTVLTTDSAGNSATSEVFEFKVL